MEVKPMTVEECLEEIAKMGGYKRYLESSYANANKDTYQGLSHTIEYQLMKHGGDPVALFKARPDLHEEYRRSVSVRVGSKVKD